MTSKTVYAKIDRPAGIVDFVKPKKGDEVLNEWSSDVGKLMGLIEKSCHLIAKVSQWEMFDLRARFRGTDLPCLLNHRNKRLIKLSKRNKQRRSLQIENRNPYSC